MNHRQRFNDFLDACCHGQLEKVQLLIAEDVDLVKYSDYLGRTGLSFAIRYGHLEIVRILLKNGAQAVSRWDYAWTEADGARLFGYTFMAEIIEQSVRHYRWKHSIVYLYRLVLEMRRSENILQSLDVEGTLFEVVNLLQDTLYTKN